MFPQLFSPRVVLTLPQGQDGTEAFEDVGHSDEARALLPGMYIGDFEKNSVRGRRVCCPPAADSRSPTGIEDQGG